MINNPQKTSPAHAPLNHGVLLLVMVWIVAGMGGAHASAGEFESAARTYFENHCYECHDRATAKAGLSLEDLSPVFTQSTNLWLWTRVYDQIVSGQMPPKDKKRPPVNETTYLTTGLRVELTQASLARQRTEGRVPLRRLNQTEYEHTLGDLMGMAIPLGDTLPEDNSAAGFNKVSAVLEISPEHLLRYQDAAEKAITTVVTWHEVKPVRLRVTAAEHAARFTAFTNQVGKTVSRDGDGFRVYARAEYYQSFRSAQTPAPGRYRFRASMLARNSRGASIPVQFTRFGNQGKPLVEAVMVKDALADQASEVEFEVEMAAHEAIVPACWLQPTVRTFLQQHKGQKLEDIDSPGLVVEWMEIEGPLDWPPVGYERMFGHLPSHSASAARLAGNQPHPAPQEKPKNGAIEDSIEAHAPVSPDPKADAERLITAFVPLAFRRPVAPSVTRYYVDFAWERLARGETFYEAMKGAYKAILCSPYFLFLQEKPGPLDDHAIAARLSYFLWNSMPDGELLSLAAQGRLHDPAALDAQIERLLKHPHGARFTEDFAGQWLDLHHVHAMKPDQIYAEYDPYLDWSAPLETSLFFHEALDQNLSLLEFVQSDWTFLNERLARHYGIPGVTGSALRKTALPAGAHRGGVLTQTSILKVSANGSYTSPVLRGKWVLDRIVGRPPAPPPANVGVIEPDIRGATTIRKQLEKHRSTPACARCHDEIDPPGFALETFDVVGGWREFYRSRGTGKKEPLPNYPDLTYRPGPAVEKGYRMADGRLFGDIDEFKTLLLQDEKQLTKNLVEKVMTYATGAPPQFADREVVEQIVERLQKQNHGFRSLLHEVVRSRVFLNK